MKKLIAMLLAVLMVCSLVACSNAPAEPTAPDEPTVAAKPASEPAEKPSDVSADEPTETPVDEPVSPVDTTVSLPLTAEVVTFTGWKSGNNRIAEESNMELQDAPAFQWLEEKTNVNIEFVVEASATANEKFNLMIVSEDFTDFIYYNQSNYIGGMAKYIEDEVIVDLAPYMDEFAPNYQAIRMADEGVRRATMLDEGQIPGFYRILTEPQASWRGPLIRADWLEDAGLASPKTLDEWVNVLTVFRNREDCSIPYLFAQNSDDPALMACYGIVESNVLAPIDGVITYRYTTENYKNYLIEANKWYSNGLISPDYYGEAYSFDVGILANGDIGTTQALATFTDTIANMTNGAVRFEGAQPPTLEVGAIRTVPMVGSCAERVEAVLATITTACEDIELLVRFFDFIYSDAGYNFAIYGIEGETFTIDESGDVVFTDLVVNSEYSVMDNMGYYSIYNHLPFQNDPTSQYQLSSETALACFEAWDGNLDKENEIYMPDMVALTAEEAEEYSAIMTDISTYVSENTALFVNGTRPISEFETFVDTLYEMDLQAALDLYQAAYDRYMAR